MKGNEGMKNLSNSKLFKFFDYVFRLVLINIMIIIPSFLLLFLMSLFIKEDSPTILSYIPLIPLVLYFYPALCAGINTVRLYELKESNTLFKDFFKNFVKFYPKAILESIIISLLVFLLFNSINFFYNNLNNGAINVIGFVLSIGFSITVLAILLHVPLIMGYCEGLNIIQDVKLAVLMAFKDIIITLTIALVTGAWIYFLIMIDSAHFGLIIGGVSLPIYLLVKLTLRKYYPLYIRNKNVDERVNDNEKN